MKRREFIALLGGAALAWPLAARAQQRAMPVIGYLSSTFAASRSNLAAAFRDGLAEMGYAADHNVAVQYRWAEGEYARLPALAAELVRLQPAVIAATGGTPVIAAAKAATNTIPIVFTAGEDPVKLGFVESLARPGGNLTGATFLISGLAPKQLQLLHEIVPEAKVIGMLVNPLNPETERQAADAEAAARSLDLTLVTGEADGPSALEAAFAKLVGHQIGGLLVPADRVFNEATAQIAELAKRHRIPTCYQELQGTDGLISYGGSRAEAYWQAGVYAGKILDGAKPVDLPVVQSTKTELVINLKTAKALGLTVPQSLLVRADEIIE